MTAHTDKTYEAELAWLREKLLFMGARAQAEIADAMHAVVERDAALAERVPEADKEVNYLEIQVDDACRRMLALRQPAASDLRFVTTALKIVVDLERVGDLAVNIAERALELAQSPPLPSLSELLKLSELGQAQLQKALDAFVTGDAAAAEQLIHGDNLLDQMYLNIFNQFIAYMMEDAKNIRRATSLLFVAKHLERLGDHATNIAEMVIYMVRGTDVRHPHSR